MKFFTKKFNSIISSLRASRRGNPDCPQGHLGSTSEDFVVRPRNDRGNFAMTMRKPTVLALIALLILSSLFALTYHKPQTAHAAWYNASWNYRQKIIIDHNKVPNTDQTDFPVLIKITDASNAIFTKTQSDGDDLLFTSSNETTKLSHEIETFNTSTHELWAWVKIPTLSHLTDTTIYLYYGNASATSQQTATDVWSNGYAGVWHLPNGTSLTSNDSTSKGHNASATTATVSAGKIYGGASFNSASSQYITIGDSNDFSPPQITICAWVKRSNNNSRIVSKDGQTTERDFEFKITSGNKPEFTVWNQAGSVVTVNGGATFDTNWHYLCGKWDNTNVYTYLDGSQNYSGALTGTSVHNGSNAVEFGRAQAAAYEYYSGEMDEVHIASSARSGDWIATEYANQNSPETFFHTGGEVGKDNYTIPNEPAGWYAPDWAKRQPITLNPTSDKVPNTNQTDFPTLIKLTDVGNDLWASAQADGDDILFADTAGNKLAHEIEKYDSVAHELWAWVKVPTLATGATTTIYMHYANANAPNQQSKTAVWSNGYAGVWHLPDPTNPLDSLGLNNGTNYGVTATSGQVDGAGGFNGSSYVQLPSASSINGASQLTLSGWLNPASLPEGRWMAMYDSYVSNSYDYGITQSYSGRGGANDLEFIVRNSGDSLGYTTGNYLNVGTWVYVSSVFDGTQTGNTNRLRSYINGQSVTLTYQGAIPATTFSALNLPQVGGNPIYASGRFNGSIDDVRISSTARSADWIATEYANQNDPGSFESFGGAETSDTFAPNNPSAITALYSAGGSPILLNAGSDSTPYYSWPEPEAVGGATDQTGAYISGVAGYYSYFGTSCGGGGADPAASRGVLADTGSGLHYSSDISVSVPDLTTNQGAYCLRMKTKDNAGNISAVTQVATYIYDITSPNAPTFIAANPAGYSAVNSFDFTWPVATDVAGAGSSGIQGYQFKRGTDADWGATQAGRTATGIASYQTGGNIFLVRSVDNAGNASTQVQTTYYYSNEVPTKPTAVTPTPALSDTNSFAFSWTAPVHARPIVDYGYSINAVPTLNNLTWTGSPSTSLGVSPFATAQGVNTFYVVAKDDSGAYGVAEANYGTATFTCTTVAPPIPTAVTITDSSNRTIDLWALTIKWSAGSGQGASFNHYSIERSTDPSAGLGVGFTEIATSTGTAYIDSTGLSNTAIYYYRIKAVDNADSHSASSSIVSKIPTGRYDTPPTIVTSPTAISKATSATISWTVNRESTSSVRFAEDRSNLDRVQIDVTEETSHSINLSGLTPATTYYYEVQALDTYRDYTSEEAFSPLFELTTLPAPAITNVSVSNIKVSSADITYQTSIAAETLLTYGPSIGYGTTYDRDSATTLHTKTLSSLSPGTSYHFKINGTDQDSNTLSSDDYVFDTLPMPAISDIKYEADYSGPTPGMKITWKTNVPASSSVNYVPKLGSVFEEESKSALTLDHEIILIKLADSTEYRFYVYGTDQFGNTARSDENILSTPEDSRPSKITDITVESNNSGESQAQIHVSFETDELTTAQVEYGEGSSGDTYTSKTQEDPTLLNKHLVIILNVDASKIYHLRVASRDAAGNITYSDDNAVITKKPQLSPLNIILKALSKAFGWIEIFK